MPAPNYRSHGLLIGILVAIVLATPGTLLGQNISVQKHVRDLVVFCTNLSPTQPEPEKAFYDFIAFADVNLANSTSALQHFALTTAALKKYAIAGWCSIQWMNRG